MFRRSSTAPYVTATDKHLLATNRFQRFATLRVIPQHTVRGFKPLQCKRLFSVVPGQGDTTTTGAISSESNSSSSGDAPSNALPFILDVDATNIEQVMVQSYGVPTILDCYADWCEPCKQLAPILEDLVTRSGGKLRLAKLDVDANKELAAQLRVQSLPSVYGIAGGKVIDQFVGLPQQQQFQSFVEKLMQFEAQAGAQSQDASAPRTPEAIMDEGTQAMRRGDFDSAQKNFETIILMEQSDAEDIKAQAEREGQRSVAQKDEKQLKVEELAAIAHASLAQILLLAGDATGATAYIDDFKDKPKWSKYLHMPLVAQPLAIVNLYAKNGDLETDMAKIEQRLETNAEDHEARFSLASVLMAQGKPEDALAEAFKIIRSDKKWEEGRAKDFCLDVFNALGEQHPAVLNGRRRLSNLLF